MIHWDHPEAFLLLVPVLLWLRGRAHARALVAVLRWTLLLMLLALLARPWHAGESGGRDLVLLVDRSRSVPPGSAATVREWAAHAQRQLQPGDRMGQVGFARTACIEAAPQVEFTPPAAGTGIDTDGTDVARGLDTALALIPPGRQGSVLLLSDGEVTGRDPLPAAREALRRGVRIDVVPLRRTGLFDTAVEELTLPGEVAAREPFQFSGWVRAERAGDVPYRLLRDGVVVSEGRRTVRAGLNRFLFRDQVAAPGLHRYQLELTAESADRVPENNRARALVRVTGTRRLLCVTPGGRSDRLTRTLADAGFDVVVTAPGTAASSREALDGFRAVVLENVPAGDLPAGALGHLQGFVRDLGGGLLMTGGRASFGVGGYHQSPLEPVLPVSMEIRQEQRKFALAMAIALDRSGSMAATVADGRTKMELADLGACAAIELLSPIDAVGVFAVDTQAHEVVPLSQASDRVALTEHVRRVQSSGGGIYIGRALHATADMLLRAPQGNRHIVLFADAADSEQPEDYTTFVPSLLASGITVSVIGMGSATDKDAQLLEEIARLGKGRCFFAADPADLPRVFAEETIQVARSALVEEPTQVAMTPEIVGLGDLRGLQLPTLGGYSIAYRKPAAQVGAVTRDEIQAPCVAFWQHGLGRAAAFLGEADGTLSGGLAGWSDYGTLFTTLARWLSGSDAPESLAAELRREGHEGVLCVDVGADAAPLLANLSAVLVGPDGKPQPAVLERVAEHRLEARFPLSGEGAWQAAVRAGQDAVLRVAPITLPYSPEFEPRPDPRTGERLLARLAEISGGRVEPPPGELLAGSRESLGHRELWPWCAAAAVLLLLVEMLVRRLGLTVPVPTALRALRWPRRAAPAPGAPPPAAPAPIGPKPTAAPEAVPEPPPTPKPAAPDLASVLDSLKKRPGRS